MSEERFPCYAEGCPAERRYGELMCSECWALVPPAIQRRVHNTNRARQRFGGHIDPFVQAINAARDAVTIARQKTNERPRVEGAHPTRHPTITPATTAEGGVSQ